MSEIKDIIPEKDFKKYDFEDVPASPKPNNRPSADWANGITAAVKSSSDFFVGRKNKNEDFQISWDKANSVSDFGTGYLSQGGMISYKNGELISNVTGYLKVTITLVVRVQNDGDVQIGCKTGSNTAMGISYRTLTKGKYEQMTEVYIGYISAGERIIISLFGVPTTLMIHQMSTIKIEKLTV